MSTLSIDPAIYALLFFHCLIGGIAALVAKQKGYNFWRWFIIGLIGGTFAFTWILFRKTQDQEFHN